MKSAGFLETLSNLKISKNIILLIVISVLNIDLAFCQYKTERPFNDFLNYGIKKLKPSRGLENEILKSKVEVLGEVLKNHVDRLRKIPGQTVELVFLVDSSASVGAENFFNELKFVKKLLADFTVSYNQTRVAVVTFSSKTKVIRHIDHVTQASFENHKCSLLERELPHIRYSGGGTFTLGAMLEAQSVLAVSRPDAVKAVFLVTDGYSNGGDPRQAAEFLKSRGVIIFTFGIQNGNVKELFDMASEPKEEHSYILNSFEEFEALARRALHEDLHSGMMIAQDAAACSTLCEERGNCCDDYARCTCGTHTGHYACTCRLGYYGTGLRGDCESCPPGTFRDVEGPSDITGCKACPDPNMLGPEGATSPNQCFCNRGYTQHGLQCQRLQCPPLSPPANGHFVRESCERVVNAACGIRCRPGYQLNGSSIRLCREDGSWSGGDATCQVKTCPPSTPPKNGNMICSSETGTIDTQCHFTCKPGYQLVGSRMRTCLPVAMWDGIKAYCKPIFCTPLSQIKNGIIKPESCTIGKIKYGIRCEFGCDAGFQLSGPLKTTCIDQGVWSEGQQKARCIDVDPPSIQCPSNVVATTEPHENYANVEWTSPVVKDSSNTEVYLSTIPATKQPMKLKIGTHKITYVAKDEWGNKAKCTFHAEVKDDEPPTVDRCESPPTFLSRDDEVDVYWEEPIFSDNSGGKVTVTRSQEPGRFHQGETAVEYIATDQYGNKASCNITITVQHHACDLPMDPINGVANCSENPEAVYCTLTCTDGYAFAMRPSQDYFCAYDGVWLPENNPLPFPECSVSSISNTISQSGEIVMDEGVSVCDDIFFMGQVENQLQKKLEETLSAVCADDLLCEIATVEAVCEGLMAEMEEEFNSISYNRKKRMIDEVSFFSQYWPLDDDSSGWTYWRRGFPIEQNPTRSKRSPMSFHSNKARQKKQFGFPTGLFESANANSTNEIIKKNENNANFMGVLTGLIVQSLGKDIGMTRLSSFLSSLGSKDGTQNFGVESFIAAFAKEFGEDKTNELRLLAEATFRTRNNTELISEKNLQFPLLTDLSFSQNDSDLVENISLPSLQEALKMDKLKELNQNNFNTDTTLFPILFPGEIIGDLKTPATKKGLKIKFQVEGQGENVADKLGLAMKNILKSAEDGLFDIDYGERQIKVAAIRLSEDPEFICDPGSVLQDNNCIKCPIGAFFNVIAKNCQPCPGGSYQPEEGKVSCLVCPENTSTKDVQAKSNNDCKAMCLPGSYSNDTLEPCTTCPNGEFQDEYASKECASCPFATTTWRRGAWSVEECKPPCPVGEVSETGLKPCLPCPKDYFQPEESKIQCLKCPGSSFTKTIGSKSLFDCDGIAENSELAAFTSFEMLTVNDCFSDPCRNNGTCSPLESGYVCECLLGYIGQQCETEANECQSEPCLNNGTCVDLLGSFKCHCVSGFKGDLCETNINECVPNPCLNNASCVDLVDSFKCICESGYTGEICDVNIDECESHPCSNGSTCVDGISDYTCNCQAGFTGRHCTTDNDDCDSSPCIHGTCTDLVNDYQCSCEPGYTSKQCNIDIDDCVSSPCKNNGTCTDWLNGFSCNCFPGFTGKLCETKMSTDFVLEFASSETVNYASLENLPRALHAVTVCFWMLTKDQKNYGTPFSYATKTHDNALTLTDYSGFVLYVNGEKYITDVSANDGRWHFICVLWDSKDGNWSIHKDGYKMDSGSGLSSGKIITADGVMVLGQEQDQRGGKYSTPESFIGEMTLFNVWGEILPESKLYQFYSECSRYDGNIHSWPDFQSGVMGSVKLKSSTFCKGCGVPYAPNHGSITEIGSEAGSTVKVKCDDGYKIYLGDDERTCLVNGKWSGEEPECRGVSCGFPGHLRNGDISGFSYEFGDELAYFCNKGFRLLGSVQRTCQADGKWSGEETQCEAIVCPTPTPMENGKLVSHLGSYLPTNRATFSCQEGYQMDGPATRSCGLDGNWDGEKATCQPESCGSLPSISHGTLSGVSGAIWDSIVAHCEPGYKLKGKAEILCKENGHWEEPLPKCVKEDCEKPPAVEDGSLKIRVSTHGKEAKYSCDPGFVLDGPNLLICQEDGEWSHAFPKCILQPCPMPDVPLYAKIPTKVRWSVGDEVIYECLPGYIMSRNNKKVCKEDVYEGIWEGDAPVCAAAKCRKPLEITGGKFTVKNSSPIKDNLNSNLTPSSEVELIRLRRNAYEHVDFPSIGQEINLGPTGAEYEDFGQKQAENEDFGQKQGEYDDFGQSQSFDDFGQTQGGFDYEDFQSTLNTRGSLEIGQSEDGLDVFSQTPDGFNFDYEQKPDTLIIETYLYNTTVEYECKSGFKLIGTPTLRCGENGDWDHPEPRCYEIHCSDLKSLEHGFVTYYGSGANSRVEYHCKDGYLLLGNKEIVCQTDRTWSGKAPVCKQMKCINPVEPKNGTVSYTSVKFGSVATYDCLQGFVLEGSFERHCDINGFWNGSHPRCVGVICKTPSVIDKGYIYYEGNLDVGSSVEYGCNDCYKLVGTAKRECELDGTWSLKEPQCELIKCDSIPSELKQGRITGEDNSCGSLVEYECDPGYKIIGKTKASCQENGKWTSLVPRCEILACEAPPKLLNGKIIGSSFKFGDKVTYECDKGHNLKGNNILTCNDNQKWSGDIPSCSIIYCKKPKGPSNGKVRVNGLFYAATIMIICDPGFRLEGEGKLQCQEDGQWNKEMPFCAPLVCPAAPSPPSSFYNSTEVYFESFTYLKYSCETGYKPISENTILMCSAFGNWTGDLIDCQLVSCGNPGLLNNGQIAGNQYTFGNVIDFSCNNGFELIGEVKATCQENGQWSKKPTCQKILCNAPKQVFNGVVQASGVVGEFGSSVTYNCHNGYVLKGSAKRTCEKNKKWSGTLPVCQPVSCTEPNELINADIDGDTYTYMKNITFTCHPGFIMKGQAVLTCLETGEWSSDFPVCEIISCLEPTNILNGKWEAKKLSNIPLKAETMTLKSGKKKGNLKQGKGKHEKSKIHKTSRLTSLLNEQLENVLYRSGHIIEYTCEDGYFRSGNNLLECTENDWNSPPPTCNPVTCPFPTPVKNGRVIGNEVIFGSVLTYECNEGFEIFGATTRTCQANKEWTDVEPRCRPKECPLPAQIHNGKTNYDSLKYQTIVVYSCLPGFRLEGNSTRLCQSNERWSGSQPVCVEIFCDEPKEVPFAVRDIGHLKVGGIVRYTCMEGYQLGGKSSLSCQTDGTWNGEAPVCSQVDCGPPPTDSHLIISGDSTTYAAKVKYSCERGYRIEGDYWSTCLQSGLWSNMPPACNLVTCELPTTPEHGILLGHGGSYTHQQVPEGEFQTSFLKEDEQEELIETQNQEKKSVIKATLVSPLFRVDDEITFSCETGWEAIGEVRLSCSQDGSWSGHPPVCQRISCGPPKVPSHAKYSGENYLYSDLVNFSCEQGYVMRGHASIQCSKLGEWSDDYPACEPLSCGPPTVQPHSFVSYQTPEHGLEHHFGSIVTYFCEPGYQLEGSLYMTCSASFKWVGPRETPRCVEMSCDKPPLIAHAFGVEETGSKPQRVNYQCNPGYLLSGNGVIECSLGKWMAINFTCNPVNCFEPRRPDNGIISAKHFMLGSVAEYSCIQGYILDGNPSAECTVEGTWSGHVPTCKPVNCWVPEGPLNGKVSYNTTLYASSASYTCDEGHELKGDVSRLCASDGNWSGHLPQCHRVSCGELRPPYRGYVIGVGQLYGDEVKFTCDKGYVLQGNDTLVCQGNGRWSESGQRCESVRCIPPGFILNGQPPIDLTKDYVYGDRISYTCNNGHIPRGDMTSVCQKGGTWSQVKGQCSLISCGRPKLNKDGAVILGRSFYYKDKIKIDCPTGTKPKGLTYLTCLSDGSWSGEASCVSECSKKCLNGGVCLSENLCSCPAGYIGKRCQHAACILPCLNGGTCVAPYKCQCPEGFQGTRCQMPLCPLPCLNGGVCTGPHKCTCLPGYAGTRCQTPVCEHSCGIYGTCIGPNVCLCKYGETWPICPEYNDYEEQTLQHETQFSDWDIAAFRRMRINKEQ